VKAALAGLVILASNAAAAACHSDVATLRGPHGIARFSVELATDPVSRAQGLMFREVLPRFSGMLFVYENVEEASFWMKNTLIPLDMIFLDASGTVISVHSHAMPGDLTPIPSQGAVRAVLEVNGGLAESLAIAPGAVMQHPAFASGPPAWPCD
jgi:uncharacterized protein